MSNELLEPRNQENLEKRKQTLDQLFAEAREKLEKILNEMEIDEEMSTLKEMTLAVSTTFREKDLDEICTTEDIRKFAAENFDSYVHSKAITALICILDKNRFTYREILSIKLTDFLKQKLVGAHTINFIHDFLQQKGFSNKEKLLVQHTNSVENQNDRRSKFPIFGY